MSNQQQKCRFCKTKLTKKDPEVSCCTKCWNDILYPTSLLINLIMDKGFNCCYRNYWKNHENE